MKYLLMTAVLLALSSGRILLAADTVPEFKIESCSAAEAMSGSVGRNVQACFQDEQTAKDTLRQNWSSHDRHPKPKGGQKDEDLSWCRQARWSALPAVFCYDRRVPQPQVVPWP